MTFDGKKVTEDILEEILKLHGAGLTNRQIAKIVNLHHNTVGYYLKKNSLSANGNSNYGLDRVDENRSRCRICKTIKCNSVFVVIRKGKECTVSACRECTYVKQREAKNKNVESFFKEKLSRLKTRAKKENIPFNLTLWDLISSWEDQGGKCFYTDAKLIAQVGQGLDKHSLSVDRVFPENGYDPNNVVLCTHQANTIKSNMTIFELKEWIPGWYERLKFVGYVQEDWFGNIAYDGFGNQIKITPQA